MLNPDDFYLEEYKWLRVEISGNVKETRALERYALLGAAAVWAWIFTNGGDSSLPPGAWYIPSVLVLTGALRSLTLWLDVRNIATYIREVESAVKDSRNNIIGWETWLDQQSNKPSDRTASKLKELMGVLKDAFTSKYTLMTIGFWLLLFVVTLVGGYCLRS
uniref:Uncharacterized protein n=1 Tax=Candidatus Kentrum sp. LFY TaxID=2126342 RepID=A0A450V926_9GAMM|nr:MAG: hypothetical protein BECKLFY1418A_GA0070994_11416 [Candidatus Kentron sp. LFY]